MLIGGFNIDLNKSNRAWDSIIVSYKFKQLTYWPTRITHTSTTLIDHIYVFDPVNINQCFVPVSAVSNHYPICCTWSKAGLKFPQNKHPSIKYWHINTLNPDLFLQNFLNSWLNHVYQLSDPEVSLAYWIKKTLDSVFNTYVKVKEFHVKNQEKLHSHKWSSKDHERARFSSQK